MLGFLRNIGLGLKFLIGLITKTILFLVLICLTLGVIGGAIAGVKLYPELQEAKKISYDKLMSIDESTFRLLDDTLIYDNKGEILTEINIGNYEYVDIDDVSKWLTEGYIAVEDQNFKTHNGIDYKAILRAAIDIIKNKGDITQGGSTITQQVLKNNLLTNEKSFKRKFIEFYLAPQVEKQYSKSEIMEFYINTNSYGNNCEGVGVASKYYFGKEVKDLNIEEAALLVGISNNPTAYNPKTRPEIAKDKRDFVLRMMFERSVITQEEYEKAKATDIVLVLDREIREPENYQVSFAIHSAVLKIMELEGFEFKYTYRDKEDYDIYKAKYSEVYNEVADRVRKGGYKIYTSLDNEKQSLLQNIVDNKLKTYKEKAEDGRYTMQGSATLVNNETGYVEAIIGGRGTEDQYNRGFLAARQPGSSIKPILSYGIAYNTGDYYPSLKVEDKYDKKGPKNWDSVYRGDISLREAMCRSVNTVAFNLMVEIGADTALEYLDKMRFSDLTYMDNGNNALALGGFTYGATTLDMAKAYSTIENYGEYRDNLCITKIEFQNEGVIYDGEINTTKVYEPDAAYMVLESLYSNMTKPYGLGTSLNVKNAVVGGKSGTTNSQKDVWFCGVSDYYSLAVWVGYDSPKSTGLYGVGIPGQIWKETMTQLHEGLEKREFDRPDTITEKYVNWKGEYVDYNSGSKDLYSEVLMNKKNDELLEQLLQETKEREEKLISEIEGSLEVLKMYEVVDESSISHIDTMSENIIYKINNLNSDSLRMNYKLKLESVLNSFEEVLKPFREKQEQERLEKEEQERLEKQEQNKLYTQIEEQIILLAFTTIKDETTIEKVYSIEKELKSLISMVKDENQKSEYTSKLSDMMDRLNMEIEDYYESLSDRIEVKEPLEGEEKKENN